MATRKIVRSDEAPEAIGLYSQAVQHGDLLYCSGQVPLDPNTGELVGGSVSDQARRCLENLEALCRSAGTRLARAVRVSVYLVDMGEFAAVNEVYADFFEGDPPARVAIGVAALPKGAPVEMDAVVAV